MDAKLPDWDARVAAVVRAIPRGSVLSYGEVARRAGRPGHARQVARALAASADRDLPWYRVLRADGRPGLAPASDAWRTQCRRLAEEGVVMRAGRVRMQRRPAQDLDELLWAPDRT